MNAHYRSLGLLAMITSSLALVAMSAAEAGAPTEGYDPTPPEGSTEVQADETTAAEAGVEAELEDSDGGVPHDEDQEDQSGDAESDGEEDEHADGDSEE